MQIARGLAAAHTKGIVHRDLKPENVFLMHDGQVKILDFGLARQVATATDATATAGALTDPGTVMGTVGYMAPEQVRGQDTDARTDLFALGAVLYEMLSGRRAFKGDTAADTMFAVVKEDPPQLTAGRGDVPPALDRIVRHCLEKNPAERFQTARDVAFALEGLAGVSSDARVNVPAVNARRRSRAVVWMAGPIAAAGLAALGAWQLRSAATTDSRTVRFSFPLPALSRSELTGLASAPLAISPTGNRLAYVARGRLYVRDIARFEAEPVPSTDGAEGPFFSPDGEWLGFSAGGRLQRVSLSGGAPLTIAPVGQVMGASWRQDGTILLGGGVGSGLRRIDVADGRLEPLTTPDATKGEITHGLPHFLPGGQEVLFTIGAGSGSRIGVYSFRTGTWREILPSGGTAQYLTSGHVVFSERGNLRIAPFDVRSAEVSGDVVPVLDAVAWQNLAGLETAWFASTPQGDLVYVPGTHVAQQTTPVWVNRTGVETRIEGIPPGRYVGPVLSPDAARVAFSRIEGNGVGQIWIMNFVDGRMETFQTPTADYNITWLPGSEGGFAYTSNGDLFERRAGLDEAPARLSDDPSYEFPTSWSPDGRVLAFMRLMPARIEAWTMERGQQPRRLFDGTSNFGNVMFSPQGGMMAYVSDETETREVYIRRFPGSERGRRVSTDGGEQPVWSHDGRELFYRRGNNMMAVKVTTEPALEIGPPQKLWERHYFTQAFLRGSYDVAPDGRFLMLAVAPEASEAHQANVVLNWSATLDTGAGR